MRLRSQQPNALMLGMGNFQPCLMFEFYFLQIIQAFKKIFSSLNISLSKCYKNLSLKLAWAVTHHVKKDLLCYNPEWFSPSPYFPSLLLSLSEKDWTLFFTLLQVPASISSPVWGSCGCSESTLYRNQWICQQVLWMGRRRRRPLQSLWEKRVADHSFWPSGCKVCHACPHESHPFQGKICSSLGRWFFIRWTLWFDLQVAK